MFLRTSTFQPPEWQHSDRPNSSSILQDAGCKPLETPGTLLDADQRARSWNESKRLRERYQPFNIAELSKAAAESVGRSSNDVQYINKLAEGGFNRIFELTMNDGFQLIARLPYSLTQPKRLAVASEVATMN